MPCNKVMISNGYNPIPIWGLSFEVKTFRFPNFIIPRDRTGRSCVKVTTICVLNEIDTQYNITLYIVGTHVLNRLRFVWYDLTNYSRVYFIDYEKCLYSHAYTSPFNFSIDEVLLFFIQFKSHVNTYYYINLMTLTFH